MATNEVDLYELPASPPCRAVKMAAHLVGVNLNLHFVDLMHGKHLEPEFTKMNPFHKVPVMNDHGFVLFESNAILRYLVNKFSPGSSLYPQDLQKRAVIDQWMSVAGSHLFTIACAVMRPQIYRGDEPSEDAILRSRECLSILDSTIPTKAFLTGDTITLADIALVTALSEFEMACFDMSTYTNVLDYIRRIREKLSPMYAEINDEAEASLKKFVQEKKAMKQNMPSH